MADLGVDFNDIGQVTYNEEDIANLKEISTKIKNDNQNNITPFSGEANAQVYSNYNISKNDEALPEELPPEEIQKAAENKKFVNSNNTPNTKKDIFDNYHNFYINFFKYLKFFLGTELTKGYDTRNNSVEHIKNFTLNYGSQIMSNFNYYNSGTYELPAAFINIIDIRPLDPVQYISRQTFGKTPANKVIIAENNTLGEVIFASLQYNYINLNVEIKFESSSELLDYISNLNTHIPLNYTVYGPKYFNYISLSTETKEWLLEHEYYGIIVIPSNTYLNRLGTYGKLDFSPTIELNSISHSVTKESNENILNLDFIFGITIPTNVFKKTKFSIEKITTDINVTSRSEIINELPFIDTITDSSYIQNEKLTVGSKSFIIKNSILLKPENFIIEYPYKILNFGTDIDFKKFLNFSDSSSNNNFSGIAFWEKYSDVNLKPGEFFLPLNYFFKDNEESMFYREDIYFRKHTNQSEQEFQNMIEISIQKNLEILKDKNIKHKLFRYVILPESNSGTELSMEEEENLRKTEDFPTETNFWYSIKSKYILVPNSNFNNKFEVVKNNTSILMYN